MLPFLDKKRMYTTIMAKRGKSPDMEIANEVEAPESVIDASLKSAAEDIMRAIQSKSVIDLASALKAAYEACEGDEAEPQSEGEIE